MDVLHNTSYIFLPFSYRSDGSFAELNRKLGENRFIKPFTNKILYMFRALIVCIAVLSIVNLLRIRKRR